MVIIDLVGEFLMIIIGWVGELFKLIEIKIFVLK